MYDFLSTKVLVLLGINLLPW